MIRVFPFKNNWTPTDDLAFIGEPPLFLPASADVPVHVSVTFTWHKRAAERIADSWRVFFKNVQVGGPAYGDPGGEFTPGRYLKDGCTITSRGCPKTCGWCVVPKREGAIRELEIKPGWIVQDNNLLACSERHLRAVFEMLRAQNRRIFFNGGLDKHFLKDWHRTLFDSIRIGELWFACDTAGDVTQLERVARILDGIPMRKRRCYTMIGYDDETLLDAERRIERVFALGFMPFTQLFQSEAPRVYTRDWLALRKKWCRPAAYMGRGADPIRALTQAEAR